MFIQLRFIIGVLLSIPVLPLLYLQGKGVRKKVPQLPSAKNPAGIVSCENDVEPLKVITLGESTMAGLGVEFHEDGFTAALARHLSIELRRSIAWSVYAKSGYNAKDSLEDLVPQITEDSADLIIIGLGANDAIERNTPQNWKNDIIHLVDGLRKRFPTTPIAFLNMPPIREFPAFPALLQFFLGNLVELHGRKLVEVAEEEANVFYNAEVISTQKWKQRFDLDGSPDDFYSDGVHPSGLTYKLWAKDFCRFLMEQNVLRAN